MPAKLMRRLLWKRRVAEAHRWCDAERHQVAQYDAAVARIIAQAPTVPDPARRHR